MEYELLLNYSPRREWAIKQAMVLLDCSTQRSVMDSWSRRRMTGRMEEALTLTHLLERRS